MYQLSESNPLTGKTHDQNHWPIFVVSLSDSKARQARIDTQIKALDLPYTTVDAIDGRQGLSPDYETMIDRRGTRANFGRALSDVEYACALSHISIYRRIREEDLPGAIVLEDDAILTPAFPDFLAARGYEAADVVQMYHLHADIWRMAPIQKLTPGIRLAAVARNASSATGYTISRKGAGYILDQGLPLRGPADWPVDTTFFPALLTLPRIVDHPDAETADSAIETARGELVAAYSNSRPNCKRRFFRAVYWQRWWFKRRTKRVS